MELPNRKQRRAWAKQLGLLKEKSKLPLEKQLELSRRAAEAGRQIHLRNVEKNLERLDKTQEELAQKQREVELQELIDSGHSTEEALAILSKKSE
jgi:hypothetical protein